MARRINRSFVLGLLFVITSGVEGACRGADEVPQPEQLPPPKAIVPEVVVPQERYIAPVHVRTSRYDVWQYYAPDRMGRYRPRVIYSSHGSYYLYDGKPFPWVTTHEREFMPYVVD
jgi:hypothetical protein